MVSLKEIEEYVSANGSGREIREYKNLIWSKGICYAFDKDRGRWRPYIDRAFASLGTDDYEKYAEEGARVIPGHEHNICESPFGDDENTGIIIDKGYKFFYMHFHFEKNIML